MSSPKIYNSLVDDVYVGDLVDYYSLKFSSSFKLSLSHLSPHDIFQCISDNMNSVSAPPFLLFHHFRLLHNALPTSRRIRHFSGTHVADVACCFFCGKDQDSIIHILSSCAVVNRARVLFLNKLSLDTSLFDSLSSPSCFPPRSHLFPSLVRFLSSLLSPIPPAPVSVSGEVPIAPSLLLNVPSALILPILCFNFAVWKYRTPAAAARVSQSAEWLCSHLVDLSSNLLTSALSFKKKKKASNSNGPTNSNYAKLHDSVVSAFKDDVAICYTDGSALSNPGPCGAGVSIFFCDSDQIVDAGASLGNGTNNIGELAAIFVCLSELLRLFELKHFSRAVIFCDSKYAMNCASSEAEPTSNRDLVLILRSTLIKARSLFLVDFCWVKGHAEIGGNIRVDQLSKFFASAVPTVSGSDYVARARNYFARSMAFLCLLSLIITSESLTQLFI